MKRSSIISIRSSFLKIFFGCILQNSFFLLKTELLDQNSSHIELVNLNQLSSVGKSINFLSGSIFFTALLVAFTLPKPFSSKTHSLNIFCSAFSALVNAFSAFNAFCSAAIALDCFISHFLSKSNCVDSSINLLLAHTLSAMSSTILAHLLVAYSFTALDTERPSCFVNDFKSSNLLTIFLGNHRVLVAAILNAGLSIIFLPTNIAIVVHKSVQANAQPHTTISDNHIILFLPDVSSLSTNASFIPLDILTSFERFFISGRFCLLASSSINVLIQLLILPSHCLVAHAFKSQVILNKFKALSISLLTCRVSLSVNHVVSALVIRVCISLNFFSIQATHSNSSLNAFNHADTSSLLNTHLADFTASLSLLNESVLNSCSLFTIPSCQSKAFTSSIIPFSIRNLLGDWLAGRAFFILLISLGFSLSVVSISFSLNHAAHFFTHIHNHLSASACILIGLVNLSAVSSLAANQVRFLDLATFFAIDNPQVTASNTSAGFSTNNSFILQGSLAILFNSCESTQLNSFASSDENTSSHSSKNNLLSPDCTNESDKVCMLLNVHTGLDATEIKSHAIWTVLAGKFPKNFSPDSTMLSSTSD